MNRCDGAKDVSFYRRRSCYRFVSSVDAGNNWVYGFL